jgi:hypothetical protein
LPVNCPYPLSSTLVNELQKIKIVWHINGKEEEEMRKLKTPEADPERYE